MITECTGPVSYRCKLPDGRNIKRHQDQLHERTVVSPPREPEPTISVVPGLQNLPAPIAAGGSPQVSSGSKDLGIRRSTRCSRPPDKLDL